MPGIFIGATGENVGKTTTSLGIYSLLKNKFSNVGFIKPVGQRTVCIDDIDVDKDIVLFKDYFNIASLPSDMSPVTFTAGISKKVIDQHISTSLLLESIHSAYQKISKQNDFVLVEGTGHIGVGSVASINNAQVASMLGLDIVLIASGGIGSCIDSIILNLSLCREYNVNVKGIIINKVIPEKLEMIKYYITKYLNTYDIPILGFLPYTQDLSLPTMRDFELLFQTKMHSGESKRLSSFKNPLLVSESRSTFLAQISSHQLIITPVCREDIAYAAIEFYSCNPSSHLGIILTGDQPISNHLKKALTNVNLPALHAAHSSYEVMSKISNYSVKIRSHDTAKIDTAISLVNKYLRISDFV